MKNNRRILAMVAILALAVLITGIVAAGGSKERPFKASSYEWVTSEGMVDGDACPAFTVNIEGYGEGTHLGEFTAVGRHCFTPPDHPAFTGAVMHDGWFEMTAANGDKLWGSYSGELQPTEFGPDGPTRGIITGQRVVEGGTGRFANASGEHTTVGDYDLVTDTGDFEMDGWITY